MDLQIPKPTGSYSAGTTPFRMIDGGVISLAGGAAALLARARELSEGNPQLALHLVDFVLDGVEDAAAPTAMALALKAELLQARAREMESFISFNILNVGARMIQEQSP